MPVSQLQELCAKTGIKTPEYRLVRAEGQSHSMLFTMQCVIDGIICFHLILVIT
jgi:dsRNA-specific ribonuclease